MAGRKNKKGRVIGGMLIRVRKRIDRGREEGRNRRDNNKGDRNYGEKIENYENLYKQGSGGKIEEGGWVKKNKRGIRTIFGGDFNTRISEIGG